MTSSVISVFGKKDYGKTTYIKNRIINHKRVIIYDFTGDFEKGYTVLYSYKELLEHIKKNDKFKVSLRTNKKEFEKINKLVFDLGHITYCVDEADQIMSANYIPEYLSYIIRYGVHKNIILYGSSRRPACVSREFTAGSDIITIFRITELIDLKYLNEYNYTNVDISKLDKHKYIELKI